MSSSTTRLYAEESTGKHLANIKVESVKANRLALPKLLFTSPGPLPKGKYHFAHCGGDEMGRGILTSFHTLKNKCGELLLTWKDKQPLPINVSAFSVLTSFHTLKNKYDELLTWKDKQPLPINVAASSAFCVVEGAFLGILIHTMIQACVGPQATDLFLGSKGPWVLARSLAAVLGVQSGLHTIMLDIRGTTDLMTSIVVGSGTGLTLPLLLRQPPLVVLTYSLYTVAWHVIAFKVLKPRIPRLRATKAEKKRKT